MAGTLGRGGGLADPPGMPPGMPLGAPRSSRSFGAPSDASAEGARIGGGTAAFRIRDGGGGSGAEGSDARAATRSIVQSTKNTGNAPLRRRSRILLGLLRLVRVLQSGAFINHMWGEAGTVLSRFQMFMIRLFMIWPLKAITPAAYAYWTWEIAKHIRGAPPRSVGGAVGPLRWQPALRSTAAWLGRESLRVWLAVEALFFLYYRFKHWQLESRIASAPLLQPGKTMEALRKALETVEMIQSGGKMIEPHLSFSQSMPLLHGWQGDHRISPQTSAQDLQSMLRCEDSESGIEDLLRDWNEARRHASSVDFAPTVVTDSERVAMEQMVDQVEVLALKRAEAAGWFLKWPNRTERWPIGRLGELRRSNILQWIGWAFFHCEIHEIPKNREAEAQELADEIIRWVELEVQPGHNQKACAMRLTMDPIPSSHRPLFYYAVTHWLFSQIIHIHFRGLGFVVRFSGTMCYWHRQGRRRARPPTSNGKDPSTEGMYESELPIVFCHGIGVNLLPYRPFIEEMMRRMPDRSFFLISLPHISMRIKEEVPSSMETVACLKDMLASWGYSSAHFVGHSFGSLPLAWMAMKEPSFVGTMTFIDPVCFLLIKPDVCYNFMYREPNDPTQLLIHYFLAQELYIAHSLSRNFFWYQNQLWPEDLPAPTLVVLSGRDSIVPAHSVRRYLMAYKQRKSVNDLRVLWFPDLGHGEINFGPVGEAACTRIVSEMLDLEAEFPRKVVVAPPRFTASANDADGD